MTKDDFFNLVYIDDKYTDFLYNVADSRVSFNNNKNYQRPYIGVVFALNNKYFFAPMTTSNKGEKLYLCPKAEDITFLPINNCQDGGVNFNNMIPVVEGVVHKADLVLKQSDPEWIYNKKLHLLKAQRFIRKNTERIVEKAIYLYDMKTNGRLNYHFNRITCNFKRLESAAVHYDIFREKEMTAINEIKTEIYGSSSGNIINTSLYAAELMNKYKLTEEQFTKAQKVFEKDFKNDDKMSLETLIRNNILFALDGIFDNEHTNAKFNDDSRYKEIKEKIVADANQNRAVTAAEQTKSQQKTQEKIAQKPAQTKPKKPQNDDFNVR
jgi:hypothetical protein